MKSDIQTAILNLFERIHPFVGQLNYVFDCLYLPQENRCVLIELSPLLPCTGPALFHWKNDADLLARGPLTFRLKTELMETHSHKALDELVETNWVDRWAKEVPHYRTFYDGCSPASPPPTPRLVLGRSPPAPPILTLVNQWRRYQSLLWALLVVLVLSAGVWHWLEWRDWKMLVSTAVAIVWGAWKWSPPPIPRMRVPFDGQRLFVYGTLKRGFHWHSKFLSAARFVGKGVTCDRYPLVFGDSGIQPHNGIIL